MSNPLYKALGGNQPNIMQMLQQFKSNPAQFLMNSKFKIPQNIDTSNAQSIVNYLVQSGQVNQEQINRAYQIAQKFK